MLQVSFIKSLISVGGGTVVTNLGRLLSIIIATRFIQPEKLGVYFILLAVIQIFSTVAACGTTTTIVKFLAEESDGKERQILIFSVINLQICALLITTAFTLILNFYFKYTVIDILYILLFISLSLFAYLNSILQGLKRFKIISYVNALSGMLKVVLVLLFVAYYNWGMKGLMISLILSNVFPMVMQLHPLYKNTTPSDWTIIDKAKIKKMLIFSYPLYLNNLFSIAFDRGYTLMIAWLLSPTAVAYYSIAERIPSILDQVRQVYSTVFFPEVVSLLKIDRAKAEYLLRISIEIAFLSLTAITFAFFIIGDRIIVLMFSEEYKQVTITVALLIFAKVFLFSGNFMGQTLVALGLNKAPIKINIGVTSLIVVLCYFFLPPFGYIAVAYISLITSIIGCFATMGYLRLHKIKIRFDKITIALSVVFFIVVESFINNNRIFIALSSFVFLFLFILSSKNLCKTIAESRNDKNSIQACAE